MSVSLNFDTEQLSSMELYSLQLQKVIADFTEFDAVTKAYVDDKVSQAKQQLTDGATEALDTFKELEDYLTASGVAGGLVQQISALSASIATEKTRAEGAEATLQSNIVANSALIVNKTGEVQGAVNNEEDRARNAETTLDAKIDAETARAQTKESELQSEVDVTQVALGVNSEGKYQASGAATHISGATSFKDADELLDVAIVSEKTRAEGAEAGLSADIQAEATRAQGAEGTLQSNINAEVLRATNREGDLQTAVDNEEARATAAETGLSADIQAEAARASAAEETLQSNIVANSALIVNKTGEVQGAVNNEEDRARNAETTLDAKIDAETARAQAAEFSLGTALGEEQTRAQNAEAFLEGELNAQKTKQDDDYNNNVNRLNGHEADIQALGERPHDASIGGFDVQHQDGNPENKYMYFSKRWRLFGSSSGDRLIFEYNKGDDVTPNWKSAVPFISHV